MAWIGALLGWVLGMILDGADMYSQSISLMWAALGYLLARQYQLGQALEKLQRPDSSPQAGAQPASRGPLPLAPPPAAAAATVDPVLVPPVRVAEPPPRPRAVVRVKVSNKPAVPDWFERVFSSVIGWFGEGNAVVKVGVLLIFMGAVFLLRLVSARYSVPIELRFWGVASLALAMLGIGWWQRKARHGYAMVLQGGGVGVLYLTIFAAFRLYHLLSSEWAFVLMVLVVLLSSALAVLQNGLALAVLGSAGGFLAPILTSTGQGSHVGLFSWYVLLNAGIVGIARYRAWRSLNVLGFVFTFGIGSTWGLTRYEPDMLVTCLPFLLLFFALYLVLGVAFASQRVREGGRPDIVDGTLVFGTPIVTFGLLAGMLQDIPWGTTWAALGFAACYLGLGWYLRQRSGYRLLLESYLVVGTVFVSLAIPLALSARWTAAGWGLESAALIWMGLRQGRLSQRCMGYLLALAAGGAAVLSAVVYVLDTTVPGIVLGGVIAAVGSLLGGWLLSRGEAARLQWEASVEALLLGWGCLIWLFIGWRGIEWMWSALDAWHLGLMWLAALGLGLWVSWQMGGWQLSRRPLQAFPVLYWLVFFPVLWAGESVLPTEHYGWLAWPLALGVQYLILSGWRQAPASRWQWVSHTLVGLLVAAWLSLLLGRGMVAWLDASHWAALTWDTDNAWHRVGYALPILALLAGLPRLGKYAPVSWSVQAYQFGVVPLLALVLSVWFVLSNITASGNAWPLPFLPLLHPLDILSLLVVGQLWVMTRKADYQSWLLANVPGWTVPAISAAMLFLWSNMLLVRCFHQWQGMPLTAADALDTMPLQAAISLLWATIALLAMFLAARRAQRELWFAGAALLAVLIGKLMLVDLSHAGGVARVVSFMGVGLFTLAMGYFAPLPARQDQNRLNEEL